jgi:hypothetical protein
MDLIERLKEYVGATPSAEFHTVYDEDIPIDPESVWYGVAVVSEERAANGWYAETGPMVVFKFDANTIGLPPWNATDRFRLDGLHDSATFEDVTGYTVKETGPLKTVEVYARDVTFKDVL